MNHIRPSKKLNATVLQIYKGNLLTCTPEHISNLLGCTVEMAGKD